MKAELGQAEAPKQLNQGTPQAQGQPQQPQPDHQQYPGGGHQ